MNTPSVSEETKKEEESASASTPTQQKLITVKEAAQSLVNRLKKIHADDRYKSVWFSYANHGCVYDGPKYDKELERLQEALAQNLPLTSTGDNSIVVGVEREAQSLLQPEASTEQEWRIEQKYNGGNVFVLFAGDKQLSVSRDRAKLQIILNAHNSACSILRQKGKDEAATPFPQEFIELGIRLSFVQRMADELHANRHKGDFNTWSPRWIKAVRELEYHQTKLRDALEREFGDKVSEHAADVANIAMKIDERFGAGSVPQIPMAAIHSTAPKETKKEEESASAGNAAHEVSSSFSGQVTPAPRPSNTKDIGTQLAKEIVRHIRVQCGYDIPVEHEEAIAIQIDDTVASESSSVAGRLKKAQEAIKWALGEHDTDGFRERYAGDPPYWWRRELRERAGLSQAGERSPSDTGLLASAKSAGLAGAVTAKLEEIATKRCAKAFADHVQWSPVTGKENYIKLTAKKLLTIIQEAVSAAIALAEQVEKEKSLDSQPSST